MIKRTALLLLMLPLTGYMALAQTVKRTSYIANSSITERFEVQKNDKKIRDGEFTATFKNVIVAKGKYKNGSRAGSWSFFDTKGKLVQVYDYSINKFVLLDTPDTHGLKCFVENVKPQDVVTVPVKIGGSCYGLLPLVYRDELSQMMRADFPGLQKAQYTHVITINDKGMVISHKVTALVNNSSKVYTLDDSRLDPDITTFTPATINHKPVVCQITTVTYGGFYGAVTRDY